MNLCKRFSVAAVCFGITVGLASRANSEPIPEDMQKHVSKGLEWLKKTQGKDGTWSANGQNPVAMTSLAGLALLMEGSTTTQGKYQEQISKAAEWLINRSNRGGTRNGLIGMPENPGESGRYMYGHGFAMLFLASCYGEENDKERRDKLKDVLTRSVTYCGSAQSTQGGWFYTSKTEGHDSDEGSVTVTQMQGIRACRDAGIPVPKEISKKGYDYLKKSTTPDGGVVYSLGRGGIGAPAGGGRPALTAAAIACFFAAGEYKDPNVQKWFQFCKRQIPDGGGGGGGRLGHDEYTHFYYAPSIYFLGEEGWNKMFPNEAKGAGLSWKRYRDGFLANICKNQSADGSWPQGGGWSVGPVYSTAVYCTILQLDNNCLPVFQR
jgi:squalene cyclase